MSTPAQRLESERTLYPAMQVDEILVWRVWLKAHQSEFDRFAYNVYLGPEQDPGPAFTPAVRQWAIKARQLRIDAVGYQGSTATLFEVERYGNSRSVGQLHNYSTEWSAGNMLPANPALVLVAASVSPNILSALRAIGATVNLVPGVNFSVLAPGRLIPNP
jgi:hypothetical protein